MTAPAPTRSKRPEGSGQLAVFADLRIETDGQRAHLVGDGKSLILHTDQPLRFWRSIDHAALPAGVGRVNGPRALGRVADALHDAGVTVDVTGPDGVLVRLGDGAGSRLGKLVTGSSAVGFGSVRLLASTVSARLPVGRIAAALALVAVLGVITAVRRRR